MKDEGGRMKKDGRRDRLLVRSFLPAHPSSFIPHPSSLLERHTDRFHYFFQNCFCLFATTHGRGEAGADEYAVGKNGNNQPFDIVGNTIGTFFSEREGLRCAEQRQGPTRAHA